MVINYFLTMHNKTLHIVTFILLIAGGLNWLLYGLLDFNAVMYVGSLLGSIGETVETGIYALIGLSAVYELMMHKTMCKMCSSGDASLL